MFKPCSGQEGCSRAMTHLHLQPARTGTGPMRPAIGALAALALCAACTPRVMVEAPKDPITINLNVKIDQEVRVKLDKEVEDLIADNPDLF